MEAKYFTGAETTKLLKDELKKNWPAIKFSVARRTGSAIRVEYTDGPAYAKVNEIARKYTGASFDGMIDLESNVDQTRVINGMPTKVHYGVTYVFVTREISDTVHAQINAAFQSKYGIAFDPRTDGRYDNGWQWHHYHEMQTNFDA